MHAKTIVITAILHLACSILWAQRDGVVGSTYLSSIRLAVDNYAIEKLSSKILLDCIYSQESGPAESRGHSKLILMAFLEKDEIQIRELFKQMPLIRTTSDESKTEGPLPDQLLEVLKSKKLAIELSTAISERRPNDGEFFPGQVVKSITNNYEFHFEIDKQKLLEQVSSGLAAFSGPSPASDGSRMFLNYADRVELLVLVPNNRLRYGEGIPKASRLHDIGHYTDGESLFKLMKVLPYCLEFNRQLEDGEGNKLENEFLRVYVN